MNSLMTMVVVAFVSLAADIWRSLMSELCTMMMYGVSNGACKRVQLAVAHGKKT